MSVEQGLGPSPDDPKRSLDIYLTQDKRWVKDTLQSISNRHGKEEFRLQSKLSKRHCSTGIDGRLWNETGILEYTGEHVPSAVTWCFLVYYLGFLFPIF